MNPREKEGRCVTSLSALLESSSENNDGGSSSVGGAAASPVDVVDLVINPALGPGIIDDMAALGVVNVFIQPGACSEEILERCSSHGISVHQGCVLIEL